MDRKQSHKLVYGYEGKIYANMILVMALALLAHALFGLAEEEVARAQGGDRYSTSEGGTIENVTINNIVSETTITETITITEEITIQNDVDPNMIWDVIAGSDWWDAIDTGDGKKKGGKGSVPTVNPVYYWDVNGVYWTEPNASPDLVVEGEHQWDSDDDALEYTDGTIDFLVAQKDKTFALTIYDPDVIAAVDVNVPIFPVEPNSFPGGITMVSLGIKTDASSTYSVSFQDYNSPTDASPDVIEVVATSGSTEAGDDGTLTKSAIAAGSIVYAIIPATDITFLQIWGTYYVNDND